MFHLCGNLLKKYQRKLWPKMFLFKPSSSSSDKSSSTKIEYDPTKPNYHLKNDAYWSADASDDKDTKVPFYALAKTFESIENISGRLKSIEIMSNYLSSVMLLSKNNDLVRSIYLCLNKVAPDYDGIELGIGTSILMKALSEATGRNMTQLKKQMNDIGDIGVCAEISKTNQQLLRQPKPLTVEHVYQTFYQIATMTGRNVMAQKIEKIKSLITCSKPIESRYIMRSLSGKMRIGLGEKSLLTSIAQAYMIYKKPELHKHINSENFKKELEKNVLLLQTAFNECPNYDKLLSALMTSGFQNLSKICYLSPGIPLKPMLAHPTKGIHEIFQRLDDIEFTCEYKYDGERAQIHRKSDGKIMIYSRNQENNTEKYPDIIKLMPNTLKNDKQIENFIIDCEAVAYDQIQRQILPFQVLSTRKRKNVNENEIKVNICLFVFDLLYLNNEPMIKKPLAERRKLLENNFNFIEGQFMIVSYKNLNQIDHIQEFLDESIRNKCEGLMIKTLTKDATYEIAKRSFKWLKLKKDYIDSVGDTLDLIPIGAYYGRGKRTGVYGGFLLACYDDKNDEFQCICKIGTGFSDDDLSKLSASLNKFVINKPKSYYNVDTDTLSADVWFEAKQVWEIKCADLSISPIYKAAIGIIDSSKGISLRFPRFIRLRDDKKPEMATTAEQIAEMYLKQEQQQLQQDQNNHDSDDDNEDGEGSSELKEENGDHKSKSDSVDEFY